MNKLPISVTAPVAAPRAYGGESHEQRCQKRRELFIAAGKHLFGTIGYRRTTVRGLCKEAGLTDRYFYESFATTEDLLVAVYAQLILTMQGAVVGALQALPEGAEPVVWIDRGLDAFFAAVEDAEAARIVWLEVLGVSPQVDALYTQTQQQFADLVLALVRMALPHWAVDDEAAPLAAMARSVRPARPPRRRHAVGATRRRRSTVVRRPGGHDPGLQRSAAPQRCGRP